ncbi:DUF928 domain-containing protein [Leptolyngbya sp. AN03gr2]|uniref:DUF928 domain-containing protein n=1 Tax=unclassified Leptolyngbya TaxID=2650499 RepID=UPI003D3191DF
MRWLILLQTSLWVVLSSGLPGSVSAQSKSPAGGGRPINRADGGDRGCNILRRNASEQLFALVPAQKEAIIYKEPGMLWVYNPYTSDQPLKAKLTLRDEKAEIVGKPIEVTLPTTPGIAGVKLPTLGKQQSYQWYFSIICSRTQPSKNPMVSGPIRRVDARSSSLTQIKPGLPSEQIAMIYAKSGLWNDAITVLASSGKIQGNTMKVWTELLRSEQLEGLANKPIAPVR